MLDLLSTLKEPKTKTLKLCGQSETTDRPDAGPAAAGQKARGPRPCREALGPLGSPATNGEASCLTKRKTQK